MFFLAVYDASKVFRFSKQFRDSTREQNRHQYTKYFNNKLIKDTVIRNEVCITIPRTLNPIPGRILITSLISLYFNINAYVVCCFQHLQMTFSESSGLLTSVTVLNSTVSVPVSQNILYYRSFAGMLFHFYKIISFYMLSWCFINLFIYYSAKSSY